MTGTWSKSALPAAVKMADGHTNNWDTTRGNVPPDVEFGVAAAPWPA